MRITLPTGTPAELVRPDGTPTRGVVIATDIHGLRPLFDDWCRRLAEEHGWAACAVEPFPGQEDLDIDGRFAVLADRYDEDVNADLTAAADALEVGPVALVGFCMGGMYALKAAALGRFDRVVSFYGMIRVPVAWRGSGQAEPLDRVTVAGASPVLAIVGGQDPWTPPEDVDALERAKVEVLRFPDAEHGFVHDPERDAHRPDDAATAWDAVVAFLDRSGDAA